MTVLIEKALHQEVMLRLNRYPVVAIPSANGIYLPRRTPAEQAVVARIVSRMKTDGMLLPGAPDLCIASRHGTIMAELKRGKSRDLFTVRPAGRQSPAQRDFQSRCEAVGVKYIIAYEWAAIEEAIEEII
jgi:hypothetical protein